MDKIENDTSHLESETSSIWSDIEKDNPVGFIIKKKKSEPKKKIPKNQVHTPRSKSLSLIIKKMEKHKRNVIRKRKQRTSFQVQPGRIRRGRVEKRNRKIRKELIRRNEIRTE